MTVLRSFLKTLNSKIVIVSRRVKYVQSKKKRQGSDDRLLGTPGLSSKMEN